MTKITNTSDGKQAVHTTAGVVFIHPGKERDVELTEVGAKLVEASDTLTTGGKQARKRTQKAVDAEVKEGFGKPKDGDVRLVSGTSW